MATPNENPTPVDPNAISPKVTAGAVTGLALLFVSTVLSAITPDMLSGLGQWAGPVQGGLIVIGGTIAAWLANDPARLTTARHRAE